MRREASAAWPDSVNTVTAILNIVPCVSATAAPKQSELGRARYQHHLIMDLESANHRLCDPTQTAADLIDMFRGKPLAIGH